MGLNKSKQYILKLKKSYRSPVNKHTEPDQRLYNYIHIFMQHSLKLIWYLTGNQ